MKNYYEIPMQVKFRDDEGNEDYGIAYRDEVICGECGEVFIIGDNVIILEELDSWYGFSEYIRELIERR